MRHYAAIGDNIKLLSELKRGRIRGMMETESSAWLVTLHLSRSNFTGRRCGDQWTREKFVTQRPISGRPRQTNSRENCYIKRRARIMPTIALSTIHTQATPSLRASESVSSIARRMAEELLLLQCSIRVLPLKFVHCRPCLE
ncbi:hypothetical protein TNCV_364101 [Trichonephila clavipes]|uniref:Uncharacterized protein n=1 Tax=Trichonephila clavipes TaxID=2585209 RepID=A0A8X6VM52_TRICX|nr:hypothetical protein TNCV_364101 [Trichonephila clavipes]